MHRRFILVKSVKSLLPLQKRIHLLFETYDIGLLHLIETLNL